MRVVAALLILMLQSPAHAVATGEVEAPSFDALGIRSVSVNSGRLDVDLVGDAGLVPTLTEGVRVESPLSSRGYRILHEKSGGNLRIWVEQSPFSWPSAGDRIVVHLPRGVNARIESASGRIDVDGLSGGRFSFSTASGRIRLRNIQGTVDASTVSGGISLDSLRGRINAKTVSGAIRGVALEPTSDASFSSVSGNIDIRFRIPFEALRFELTSVSGTVTADRIRAARGLKMGSGDVLITGKTISGSQVYR